MLYDLYEATVEQIGLGGIAMYPLLITCVVMWILIFKKFVDLRSYTKGSKPSADCLAAIGKPDFSCSVWQRQLMDEYIAEQTTSKSLNRNVVDSMAIRQKVYIDKYTSTIAVLAGIAPLLGLLGTVMGMISTFEVISMYGTGNARALASGISEALITTETGLIIAVPGLFFVSFLSRQAESVYTRIQRFCILLLKVPYKNNNI